MKDVKARMASEGNNRLLAKYGGHDTGSGRLPYATGGAVTGKAAAAKYAAGGPVMEGDAAAPRLDRPGRMKTSKKDAKGGKKGTTVNVVVMSGQKPDAGAPMAPPMPPPDAGPMPPPPMRAFGGKVIARKHGGRVKREEGGRISEDSKQEAKRLRDEADKDRKSAGPSTLSGIAPMVAGALLSGVSRGRLGRAAGNTLTGLGAATGIGSGAAKLMDSYEKRSEANRIEKGMAEDGKEDRKNGGRVKMKAGAGSGEGRLEKEKEYGE